MLANRSMPSAPVIPVLTYLNVAEAADWLCAHFGFTVRLRIASHRVQLNTGNGGAVVITAGSAVAPSSVMVRVEDVDAHYERTQSGTPPVTFPYGERQYTVVDPAGHSWTFSQSVADVDPVSWLS